MSKIKCEGCGEDVLAYEITSYGSIDGGYRDICSRCFSAEMAQVCGVDNFDNSRLQPIKIVDCTGESHQFHFMTHLLGNMVTLDAFEAQEGQRAGYQFQIIGDPEEDMFALLGRMIGRIRKALSVKHLEDVGDKHVLQIADTMVHGRIDCDLSEDTHMPCVIVDGREISWVNFGRMLSSFEGWQFKLEILDRSDEL